MGFILQLRYSEGMGRKKTFGDFTCSIARTLDVVGDRWTLLVLRDVFVGINRFDEIQRDLGIARNVLAERLESLVRDGVLERRAYQERPPRHEYMLTQKGKDLQSVLLAMVAWGDRWQGAKEGPPVRGGWPCPAPLSLRRFPFSGHPMGLGGRQKPPSRRDVADSQAG